MVIDSLEGAITFFNETMARHPQRDHHVAIRAAMLGEPRPYPVIYLDHLADPADDTTAPVEYALPDVRTPDTPAGRLAQEIVAMLEPLDLLNPVDAAFVLGESPGTLITCFGIPLDPRALNSPAHTISLEEAVRRSRSNPVKSGLVPRMLDRIDLIKAHVPPSFKIKMPDVQGPFNLAHAVLGQDAFIAPCDDRRRFADFMTRVTDVWLSVYAALRQRIGPDYLHPQWTAPRISECSVNLVSPEFYIEHVLPHDERIAQTYAPLHIHPCSGPHVFKLTFEHLPVCVTEAGHIARTAAGAVTVDEAMELIGTRPVTLRIGEEPPEGDEERTIRGHLDLYERHRRLLFAYTGMHWRRADRPGIRRMHRRLDSYWAQKYGAAKTSRQCEPARRGR
ncbi:MAG: hypothetical protein QF735_00575 [Phycisphaeraceae bacterium]|jgi:hypothetical protein|nr:hypothetical protein [Phycisphaeraceae bacterium]